jgi:hypothetical protein
MLSESGTQITLNLHLAGEPVEGHVAAAGEEPRRFSGYAGLIATLESIRTRNGQDDHEERHSGRGSK